MIENDNGHQGWGVPRATIIFISEQIKKMQQKRGKMKQLCLKRKVNGFILGNFEP